MADGRKKYLFKNTLIFTFGNLATKLISFFLLPLYTNILSTEEYGTIDLIVTLSTIAIPILTLNVMESVMRFNLDKNANRNSITKNGILVLVIGGFIGLVLIPISTLFDGITDLSVLIYLYILTSACCQVFLADLRGKEKLVSYNIGNVINSFLIAVLNIYFLKYLNLGIKGYLLAFILSNSFVAIYSFVSGKAYSAIITRADKEKMKEMLKYSIVLIPNSFMWWIMNSSDRLMVTAMIGVSANGVYAISYKLPTLIVTFTGIFNQAWNYSAIRENGSEDEEQYSNNVFHSLIAFVMIIGVLLMTFIKPFLKIYVSQEYIFAWHYTPFLIIGCVYLTFATFMSTSYSVHKDSFGYLVSGVFGAALNIILNLLLIPIFDVYGAAFATCFSYVAVFLFRAIHTRKYIRYKVLTKELVVGTIVLLINGLLMYFESPLFFAIQLLLSVFCIVMFRTKWFPLLKAIIKRSGRIAKK